MRKSPLAGHLFWYADGGAETARNLAGLETANSSEFGPEGDPLVGLMTEWVCGNDRQKRQAGDDLGGTMRLGGYECDLAGKGSLAGQIYGTERITERHRHRYEVNIAYADQLAEAGLVISGLSPDGRLPEIVERPDHPFFIGVQFHPELRSKPFDPHPLFTGFVRAALDKSRLV